MKYSRAIVVTACIGGFSVVSAAPTSVKPFDHTVSSDEGAQITPSVLNSGGSHRAPAFIPSPSVTFTQNISGQTLRRRDLQKYSSAQDSRKGKSTPPTMHLDHGAAICVNGIPSGGSLTRRSGGSTLTGIGDRSHLDNAKDISVQIYNDAEVDADGQLRARSPGLAQSQPQAQPQDTEAAIKKYIHDYIDTHPQRYNETPQAYVIRMVTEIVLLNPYAQEIVRRLQQPVMSITNFVNSHPRRNDDTSEQQYIERVNWIYLEYLEAQLSDFESSNIKVPPPAADSLQQNSGVRYFPRPSSEIC